ncbi:MAG TPA: HNH endonuclease [Anaerolineae bacterium]|nr:HNH endonuclease [Anaerolineae bacterium]HIP72017.1 HNH endonuclease [Anaerolineae bacterium]
MSAYVPANLKQQIQAHFANCCAYCHTAESLTIAIFEIEHIIPRSAGGKTIFKNLCLACPTCNRFKANRQEVVDPQTQQLTPLFHPHRQLWKEHFTWNEDGAQIMVLSPTGRATIGALRMNRPQLIHVRRMWVKMGEHPPQFD